MGNALGYLYGKCCKPTTTDDSLPPHSVSTATSVSALAHDLFNFDNTSQVPEGLGKYVVSSKKAQAKWYRKILEAWKQAKTPPRTAEEASRFVTEVLKKNQKADVEGLLSFYGLPLPHTVFEHSTEAAPVSLPEGVVYEFQTLPVDPKAVADGDTITVYVSSTEPVVASSVPKEVKLAAVQRAKARETRNYTKADELHQKIVDAGYRVLNIENEEVLAKKFRIRLRGIDAPEGQMPFGKEAQEGLLEIVGWKSLKVLAYEEDQYGRCVADLYCNGVFVQEAMLKKGFAWHYIACDKRTVLANWEKEARQKRIGLWASSNPEKPWDWRRNRRV